ncbi:hypothetical protein HDU67_008862 [Dinochytrium kinnereticum]|nr:hypothetical protein HDU67_008862 [Dinochytrium kinnereticum]
MGIRRDKAHFTPRRARIALCAVILAIFMVAVVHQNIYLNRHHLKAKFVETSETVKQKVVATSADLKSTLSELTPEGIKSKLAQLPGGIKSKLLETGAGIKSKIAETSEGIKSKLAETGEGLRSLAYSAIAAARNKKGKLLFVGVFSTAEKFSRRALIRMTYKRIAPPNVDIKFVTGLPSDPNYVALLELEQAAENDILVLNITETKGQGKTIDFFSEIGRIYTKEHYQFIMKADDESWLELSNLTEWVSTMPTDGGVLFGRSEGTTMSNMGYGISIDIANRLSANPLSDDLKASDESFSEIITNMGLATHIINANDDLIECVESNKDESGPLKRTTKVIHGLQPDRWWVKYARALIPVEARYSIPVLREYLANLGIERQDELTQAYQQAEVEKEEKIQIAEDIILRETAREREFQAAETARLEEEGRRRVEEEMRVEETNMNDDEEKEIEEEMKRMEDMMKNEEGEKMVEEDVNREERIEESVKHEDEIKTNEEMMIESMIRIDEDDELQKAEDQQKEDNGMRIEAEMKLLDELERQKKEAADAEKATAESPQKPGAWEKMAGELQDDAGQVRDEEE